MKRIVMMGPVAVGAVALSAAVIGFAGVAQAEVPGQSFAEQGPALVNDSNDNDYYWQDQLVPQVKVPKVDTTVRH